MRVNEKVLRRDRVMGVIKGFEDNVLLVEANGMLYRYRLENYDSRLKIWRYTSKPISRRDLLNFEFRNARLPFLRRVK